VSDKKVNWKGVAFYAVIILIIAVVALYFLWPTGPVKITIDSLIASLHLNNIDLSSVSKLVTDNWAAIAGVAVTAVPLGYAYIKSYLDKQKLKKELESQQELAALSETKAKGTIDGLKKEVTTLKNDTTASDLKKQLGDLTGKNESLETKIKQLTAQNEQLSKTPTQMAESLWSKSGGQILEVNGEKYKIIEKTITNVI